MFGLSIILFCFVWKDEKKIFATKLNESRETTTFDFHENLSVTAKSVIIPLPLPCIQFEIRKLISYKCWMLRCRIPTNSGKRPTMPLLRSFGWHHYQKKKKNLLFFFLFHLRIFRIALSKRMRSMRYCIALYCTGGCCWMLMLMLEFAYIFQLKECVMCLRFVYLLNECSNIFGRKLFIFSRKSRITFIPI